MREVCRTTNTEVLGAALTLLLQQVAGQEARRIGSERYSVAKKDIVDLIKTGIENHDRSIDEKLTHIFDYFHFYDQEPYEYVSNIWQSWAVQPSISTKFDEYIERTVVALAVRHVGSQNWAELAYDDFLPRQRRATFGTKRFTAKSWRLILARTSKS
ncbi:MAG: hypothetical protein WDN31_02335 [Hyphomicrobium sp.]